MEFNNTIGGPAHGIVTKLCTQNYQGKFFVYLQLGLVQLLLVMALPNLQE